MKIAVFLCLLLMVGCTKKESSCIPASASYTFRQNRFLDTTAHEVSLVNGDQTVFTFHYNYEKCQGVVGAPVSREIYFSLPSTTPNEFDYSNEQLATARALVYLTAPIAPSLRLQAIVQGSLHGTRVSATKWHVTATLHQARKTLFLMRTLSGQNKLHPKLS